MSSERPSTALNSSARLTVLQFANSLAVGAVPMWPITPTHTVHPQLAPLPASAMSALPLGAAAAPAGAPSSSSALWGGFPTMSSAAAPAPLMEFPSALSLSRESAPHSHTQNHLSVSVSSFSALQAELTASKPLNHFPGFPAPLPMAAPILTSLSSHTHASISLLSSPLQPTVLSLEMSTSSSMAESSESAGKHSRRNSIHNRSVTSSNPLSSPTAATSAPAPPASSSRAFACIHAALNTSTAWLQSSSAALTLMDATHKSSKQSRNAVPLAFPSSIAPSPEQRKASA